MSDLLTVSQLGKTYLDSSKPVEAIKGFDMRIEKEEVVSIVGTSGCGKSTLLRIIAGLIDPTEGRVTIKGEPPAEYRKTGGIAFIFQKPLLFPWRTVIQNVLLGIEIRNNIAQPSDYERAKHLLKLVGLSDFEEAYPHQLSGGMLQRAAVARALLVQPQLLLMDEPFNALDEITREQLWIDFINICQNERLIAIIVTHSIREAVFLGDRVLVMSKRPGHVKGEPNIRLPQHRNRNITKSKEFVDTCEKVREMLV